MTRSSAAVVVAGLLFVVTRSAIADEPPPAPLTVDAWDARDQEARWVAIASSLARAKDEVTARKSWVEFLSRRSDHGLLEWMVIFDRRGLAFGAQQDPLEALERARAPQWPRAAAWLLEHPNSHPAEAAEMSLERRAAYAIGWLEAHPKAGGRRAALTIAKLRAKAAKPEDAGDALPPLDPTVVLRDLDAPQELADLGDATRAEPGRRYVHQVLRAIDGLVASGLVQDRSWLAKLLALTTHRDARIRRAAFLAYTHAPDALIPLDHLLSRASNPKEEAWVREAALLAFSYGRHPRVWLKLHHLASDRADPAWRTAVSRLGDMGNGFSASHLRSVQAKVDLREDWELIERELSRIEERLRALTPERTAGEVHVMLERAAFADLTCDPLEGALGPWTIEMLSTAARAPEVRSALERLRSSPLAPSAIETERGPVAERMRAYLDKILPTK